MPRTLRFAAFALLCTLGITATATATLTVTATTATAVASAQAAPVAAAQQPASGMCTTCWT